MGDGAENADTGDVWWGWYIQVHADHTFPSWRTTGILDAGGYSYQFSHLGSADRSAYPRKEAPWATMCLLQETKFFGLLSGTPKLDVVRQQAGIQFGWGRFPQT